MHAKAWRANLSERIESPERLYEQLLQELPGNLSERIERCGWPLRGKRGSSWNLSERIESKVIRNPKHCALVKGISARELKGGYVEDLQTPALPVNLSERIERS